ncbi:uracil-DNA glycosylase family protein [Neisseria chenwenguii]|uniref:Uracil-DNA glycosylase n=1 Tax=Neisseria chenwenguii TaxID=1853278 RepID=A0A220S1E4_9NEIS|nr:uracil-DNA glycosylase family protein [Neisseria chenwenguii]ASK27188.1 uracil-DNA glycosylase [Neisseria chenwenguii]ROV54890.1 uracil-DNA glycosylase [Neisseria chenwenguii]
MLSSRYLHLHEALGLGPMWLNREARFRPSDTSTTLGNRVSDGIPRAPDHAETPQTAAKPMAEAVRAVAQNHMTNAARQAAVEAVKNHAVKTARPSEPPPAVARSQAEMPQTAVPSDLSDGLAPLPQAEVRPSEVMVVSICPAVEDGAVGKLFSGSVGVLLDNMIAAVGLAPEQVHKTCWVKTPSASNTMPDTARIEAALPQMCAELAQAQPKAVWFLGQIFEQPQQVALMEMLCGETPYFTTSHPARLLRQPQLKAAAWAELKKLKRLLGH